MARHPTALSERPAGLPVRDAGPVLQRTCPCGGHTVDGGECDECRRERAGDLHRSPGSGTAAGIAPPIVHEVLRGPGQPIDPAVRSFFEHRFGKDFSRVRIYVDGPAAESARRVDALAYIVGSDVVFGAGQYAPSTPSGRRLLAHELAHVTHDGNVFRNTPRTLRIGGPGDVAERSAELSAERALRWPDRAIPALSPAEGQAILRRACLSAAACAAPIAGSSTEFGVSEEVVEKSGRARRKAMAPAKAKASGHGGPARQLEKILDAEAPGLRANIHGIFIDWDLSPGTGALTMSCASFTPPILGAIKPCVFVHGSFNQEAFKFNTTKDATIGGQPREDWRIATIQTLTHEIQHVEFDTSPKATPAGVTCSRATVDFELSELNAIVSEFPSVFRAVPPKAPKADPAQVRLDAWFKNVITNQSESIQGIFKTLRCKCDCGDVDKYVAETFNFVSGSWSATEKTAFNDELRKPGWALTWPL